MGKEKCTIVIMDTTIGVSIKVDTSSKLAIKRQRHKCGSTVLPTKLTVGTRTEKGKSSSLLS